MQRVAAVLAAISMATAVAGCGSVGDRDQVQTDTGAVQFNVLTQGDSLPEGHPPVPGYVKGLPPGHPVCPAGRQQLERGAGDGAGSSDTGPQIIST